MRRHGEAGAQQSHHRNHPVGGSREIGVEEPQGFDEVPGDAGFLFGLAQRRGHRPLVARIDAAARKGHLARMPAEVIGALGEQQAQSGRTRDHRHQNRGRIMPSNRMLRTRKATKTFVLNRGTEKRAKEKLSRPMCGKSGRKRSRKRFAIINPIGYKTKE